MDLDLYYSTITQHIQSADKINLNFSIHVLVIYTVYLAETIKWKKTRKMLLRGKICLT